MRTPIIAGNWKMNADPDTAFELMDTMLEDLDVIEGVEVVICPPFTSIETFADMFDGTTLYLGAQNMHWEEKGAYTGEISPLMLRNRCDYVILGHSERRQLFHETNENVHRKVEAALSHDLLPIICVGENLEQREAGETNDVVELQVRAAMQSMEREDAGKCVIAYEPVWAIGTGRPATGEDANSVCRLIRGLVRSMHGDHAGDDLRILYGGSVTASNIAEFLSQPEIDGALVGGASLDPDGFVRIVAQTAELYRTVTPLAEDE
ncbi:MAG TPA: triose-phosphate isomerase [Chloroflexia bacterium]|nr:triose-phosphate isomerase [Chloroflexia bacterium]